jgi:signal transducing adaptor molecule
MRMGVFVGVFQLLDACVSNCGKTFHLEVASRDFETEFRKLLSRSQPKVAEKLQQLLKKWAEGDFRNDAQLNLIPSLYAKLKQEGIDFTMTSETVKVKKTPLILETSCTRPCVAVAHFHTKCTPMNTDTTALYSRYID